MKFAVLLLLLTSCAFAQTPAPIPPAPSPGQFYGAGLSFLPQSSPKPSGNAFIAAWANASRTLININEIDFTYIRSTRSIQTAVVVDAATPVTILGRTAYAFVGAGGATGASSSAAFAAGGFLSIPIKNGWRLFPGMKVLKTSAAGTQVIGFIDIGKGQ